MKILLVTDVAPTMKKTGGIVLYQLAQFLERSSLACFVVVDRLHYTPVDEDLGVKEIKYARNLNEYPRTIAPRLTSDWLDPLAVRNLEHQLTAYAHEIHADALWIVLEGAVVISLAARMAEKKLIPMLTQVWDPPEWWIGERQVPKKSSDKILSDFGVAIRSSAACAVASWAMAKEYHCLYGVKAIPFMPSLPPEIANPAASHPSSTGPVTIAVAGQLYAHEEWRALLRALDRKSWKLKNRLVRIELIGRHDSLARKDGKILSLGWIDQSLTITKLAKADILYCPYWFDKEHEQEAKLSFPSKLVSYFAAGRPVFFHGPLYASPAQFIKQNNAGEICDSLDPVVIGAQLENLIEDTSRYAMISRNGHRAFNTYFTQSTLRKNFKSFLHQVSL